jgi:hypothetical protein
MRYRREEVPLSKSEALARKNDFTERCRRKVEHLKGQLLEADDELLESFSRPLETHVWKTRSVRPGELGYEELPPHKHFHGNQEQ